MCEGLRTCKMFWGQGGRTCSTDYCDVVWSSNKQDSLLSEQGDTKGTENTETKPCYICILNSSQ